MQPVVVGTGDRQRERGVEPVGREREQPERRVQHPDVDAFLVHPVELAGCVEAACHGIGVHLLEDPEDPFLAHRAGRIVEVALTASQV